MVLLPQDFWPLLIMNLPIVAALFIALQRKWLYTGSNVQDNNEAHAREVDAKDKEILFREQLRQEVLKDKGLIEERDKDKTEAIRELTTVVKQTLDLNDRLLNEALEQRWDGNDRRAPKAPTRARRSS